MNKLFRKNIFYATIFTAIIQFTSLGYAAENTAIISTTPETLLDGNLRDPAPSQEILSNLGEQSIKNMVSFSGGTFEMGDWGSEINEGGLPFDGSIDSKPLHKVNLNGFSIGKYPVTYAEFDKFTAALRIPRINQQKVRQKYRKPNNPAGVSWQGAKDYCTWLGKITNRSIDLPTEAQWEYSARSGGKRNVYPTDNGQRDIGRNLPSYEQRQLAGGLVEVSEFPPNPAGIYYMSAGVHEWVNDWYEADYYKNSPLNDPQGPISGMEHVLRGHFGDGGSEMTFKRWHWPSKEESGFWTVYAKNPAEKNREIPKTKYSNTADSVFRCAINKPI